MRNYQREEVSKTILKHKDAVIKIQQLPSRKKRIFVERLNEKLFIPHSTWETAYPFHLIERILQIKGPAWLCEVIMRDESPDYLQKRLRAELLGYINKKECGYPQSTSYLMM